MGRDKPVWAARCPIKSCCEEKKLLHCGQCEVFPCRKLVKFAKDKDYGDGGLRLDQCREWKDTNEQEEVKVVKNEDETERSDA